MKAFRLTTKSEDNKICRKKSGYTHRFSRLSPRISSILIREMKYCET